MSRQQPQSDGPTGNEWMVTFSDCMTLLLTFFVLLTSFATFDNRTIPELSRACAKAIPGVGLLGSSVEKTMAPKDISLTDPLQDEGP